MAVLFPRPTNQVNFAYSPTQPSQLLQGFLGVMELTNVTNGQLTQTDLDTYNQIQFLVPDVNRNVAGYLTQNYNAIAPLDGNPNSVSADDLVQLRSGLPGQQPPDNTPYNMLQQLFRFFIYLFMINPYFGQYGQLGGIPSAPTVPFGMGGMNPYAGYGGGYGYPMMPLTNLPYLNNGANPFGLQGYSGF